MRTTLKLDDDLVTTAKQMARENGVTLGHVIPELARQSLVAKAPQKVRNGVRLFGPRPGAAKPDPRMVNESHG